MANGSHASVRLIGPCLVQQHPAAVPAEFVAGAVDDEPAGRQPGLHKRPGAGHVVDVILAQDVERAHQYRLQARQFEAAESEFDVGGTPGSGAGRANPFGMDLETNHLEVGAY